jgi:prolyl-tRNA editing enzyme YbaK/EbsC (Cys-tRNA(Pro) deacylase)
MNADWPESVERVAAVLRGAAAEARLEEFPQGAQTAVDAARAVGARLSQIVKSLLFDCDGRWVLVMVPGDRRADRKKVAGVAGARRAQVAAASQVEDVTGFEPGAVAPFPLPHVERIFIDNKLLSQERVWVGAGSPNHLAGMPPAELVRLSRAEPADVSGGAAG